MAQLASELPGPVRFATCDVRDPSSIEGTVAQCVEGLGRLDVLVNNAGVFGPTPVEEVTLDAWDEVLETNLRGPFLFARAAWGHLRSSHGQIVNISSVAGVQGFVGNSAYCASKFGLNGLSEVLALEGKAHGIRVFSVCPGSVDTDLWVPHSEESERARMMRPEAVADLVRWLVASPRSIAVAPVVVTNFSSPFSQD